MNLRLSVTNGQHVFSDHTDHFDFTEAGGTIGRSARNNWVLPDPTRVVSGTHAAIGFADGQFTITDRSTNGVFLNGAEESLGNGNSTPLRDGDRILIGDFEIRVEVVAGEATAEQSLPPWPIADQSDLPPPVLPDDFNPGIAGWGETQSDHIPDVFGNIDDLGRLRPEQPDVEDITDTDTRQSHDTLPWDLNGVDGQWQMPGAQPPAPPADEAAARSGAGHDSAPPPAGAGPGNAPRPPLAPELPPEGIWPEPPAERGGADEWAVDAPEQAAWPGAVATPPEAAPEPERTPPPEEPVQGPTAAPSPGHAAAATPPPRPHAAGRSGGGQDLAPALEALLAGAGVAGIKVPNGATPEFFQAVGELLALYAGGTTELLRTIGEIKNTFRISQTQIQQTDNNPLRWAVTPKEAVKRLLSPEEDGYLRPREAVIDAIASIKAHQIGSIRGMEAAFKQFLSEQDPAELERGFERAGRPGPLTNKGAWCWQQYAAYHRRLSDNAQDNVLELLGTAFSIAYEQQVRRIRGQQR